MTHQQFRRQLWHAVPLAWRFRKEARGHYIDPRAKWRADVLAWKGTCAVALEAQLQDDGLITPRSEAYLAVGVWPLWFFPRVPRRYRASPVFTLADLSRVPQILEALAVLPEPLGYTWAEAQERMLTSLRGV